MMIIFLLNIYPWAPFTTPLYPWFSFNIQGWWPVCTKTFMSVSPSPHHYTLGSVSTFKGDDLFALKHLWVYPLHHITIPLVQFQHSSVMTFLHLNIYVWVPSTTKLYRWFNQPWFGSPIRQSLCSWLSMVVSIQQTAIVPRKSHSRAQVSFKLFHTCLVIGVWLLTNRGLINNEWLYAVSRKV